MDNEGEEENKFKSRAKSEEEIMYSSEEECIFN